MKATSWAEKDYFAKCTEVELAYSVIDELRAELAKIKQQEPIAWLNDHRTIAFTRFDMDGFPEDIRAIYTTPLYLAPGAQPVPINLTAKQLFDIYCKDTAAGDWHSYESNYYAGFRKAIAMLEAAKS